MGTRRPEPAGIVCTAVMRTRKQRDREECLLFPVEQRKAPQEQYPWHQLHPPFSRPTKTQLPGMGQLPRDWKWGPDFQPAILRWLSELQWLPRDDNLPEAHRQVSFLELALDFESYTGRPLPPTPQSRFKGGEMSLQEKGRVLRLAVSLLGKAAGRCLVPLGAGTTAGVKCRPLFTRPAAVWHHMRMQQYCAKRWAQQQQARVARQQSKRQRAQGTSCGAFGSVRHTNTDNAHYVQLWIGGCGTAVPGDMPGIHDRRWPCGATSGGHKERRPTPLGRGAHRQRRDANGSGDYLPRTGPGSTSQARNGGRTPPPPLAKRMRCTPPGAVRHGKSGTEVT